MLKQQPAVTTPLSIAKQIKDKQADARGTASTFPVNLTRKARQVGTPPCKGTPFGHHEAVKEMIKKERKTGL